MTTRTMFFGVLLGFVGISCELTESPLSDVPISEPSVIRVLAEADRDNGSTNAVSSLLMVTLYDKHDEFIEIKNGQVSVNGLSMTYCGFGQYIRTNETVSPDASYTFVVSLSDGSQYSCNVHTPKELRELTVPAQYDRKSNLVITWQTSDPEAVTTLIVKGDTVQTQYRVASGAGTFTLQPSALTRFHSGQTLKVKVLEVRTGHVDVGFMSTSSATASFSISRNMGI